MEDFDGSYREYEDSAYEITNFLDKGRVNLMIARLDHRGKLRPHYKSFINREAAIKYAKEDAAKRAELLR